MKKIITGAVLALCGTMIDCSIILGAAFYSQGLTSWSGSKLWYAIFGAERYSLWC
jgi:hypothetical protein